MYMFYRKIYKVFFFININQSINQSINETMKQKEDKSAFLEQFGDTPQLRVLDFLISEHFFDFTLTEIARQSEVSYNSLKSFLNKFLENKFLIKTRRVGKSDHYKLNTDNPIVKNIIKLAWELAKQDLDLEKNTNQEIISLKEKNNLLLSA